MEVPEGREPEWRVLEWQVPEGREPEWRVLEWQVPEGREPEWRVLEWRFLRAGFLRVGSLSGGS